MLNINPPVAMTEEKQLQAYVILFLSYPQPVGVSEI